MQYPEFNFKILALAPFTVEPPVSLDKPPMPVDRNSLDDCIAAYGIELFLPLDSHLCRSGGAAFRFDNLKAFHPDGMAKNNPFLLQLDQAKKFIQKARKTGKSPADISAGLNQWPDLPAISIKPDAPEQRQARQASTVDSILDMVAMPDEAPSAQVVYKDETDQIHALQQKILNGLFDRPDFRRMEAAWRGLRLLLQQGISQDAVRVEIAPVHPDTLESSIEALTPGLVNDPPGLILLDLPMDNSPLSLARMAKAAQWAATLMVPLVAWAPSEFLQIDSWQNLDGLAFIPNHVAGPSYAKYQALVSSDAGHWLCLTANRFLIRYPYGKDNPPRHIDFAEKRPLWIPPVWALGTVIAQSVDRTGWPTRFTDRHQFQIQDMATHTRGNTPPVVVEALFNRDRLDQFIRAGITPLAAQPGTDSAFITKAVTIADTSLAYQLLVNRVTAFVFWCQDNLPAENNPAALETQLRLAFQVFSERSRPAGFDGIEISASHPNAEGKIPVRLALQPAPSILPGRQMIEMALDW